MAEPQFTPCRILLLESRFLAKTARGEGGCLIWTGAQSVGGQRPSSGPYGSFWVGSGISAVRAHVWAAWRAGIIPSLRVPIGKHIDHICTNTLCVDAEHFELVDAEINLTRRWTRPEAEMVGPLDDVPF